MISNKRLEQGYVIEDAFGRYGDFIKQYEAPLSQILNDIL